MSWLNNIFGGGESTTTAQPARCDGAQARKLVGAGAQLLDVRTGMEFREGHIEGALNIPVDQLARRLDEVARDRSVVIYCRSGARSRRAAHMLISAGISDVHDLGPMTAW